MDEIEKLASPHRTGLRAIEKAKESGFTVTETETSFEWSGGFVKKSYIESEENLNSDFCCKLLGIE